MLFTFCVSVYFPSSGQFSCIKILFLGYITYIYIPRYQKLYSSKVIFNFKHANLMITFYEIFFCIVLSKINAILTLEYIRLSGKLMAIDNSHTKMIFSVTLLLDLFLPNFIGYRRDRYRSTLIVHKCIIDAVQNSTSKHIHARQYTEGSGK